MAIKDGPLSVDLEKHSAALDSKPLDLSDEGLLADLADSEEEATEELALEKHKNHNHHKQ